MSVPGRGSAPRGVPLPPLCTACESQARHTAAAHDTFALSAAAAGLAELDADDRWALYCAARVRTGARAWTRLDDDGRLRAVAATWLDLAHRGT